MKTRTVVVLAALAGLAGKLPAGAPEPSASQGFAAGLVGAVAGASGGEEVQSAFRALAAHKVEALPVVRAMLREGGVFEKFMLTKFLRYCPWPEARDELVALAIDPAQHWLPRQGALHALGALGDRGAGPAVAGILARADCPDGVRLAAISALARMRCSEAAGAIRSFARSDDIHLRLFAARALAGFGEEVDREFLLSALAHRDHIVRQEACGALGAAGVSGPLRELAARDPHEAVRAAAAQALLECALRGKDEAGITALLRDALPGADRLTATWIVRAMLERGGREGREFVRSLAAQDDRLGERARAYLTMEVAE